MVDLYEKVVQGVSCYSQGVVVYSSFNRARPRSEPKLCSYLSGTKDKSLQVVRCNSAHKILPRCELDLALCLRSALNGSPRAIKNKFRADRIERKIIGNRQLPALLSEFRDPDEGTLSFFGTLNHNTIILTFDGHET